MWRSDRCRWHVCASGCSFAQQVGQGILHIVGVGSAEHPDGSKKEEGAGKRLDAAVLRSQEDRQEH
eukprot:6229060-Prymnesium_polylepis.1